MLRHPFLLLAFVAAWVLFGPGVARIIRDDK